MQKTITIQEKRCEFYFFNFISNVKFVFCFCFIVCCRSSQFSSDFPEELIGIIRPDEFQNSINNINRARQRTLCEIIFSCTLILSLTLATTLVTTGLSIVWLPNRTIWIVLLSVGTAIIIVFIIQLCTIRICHWRTDSRVPRMTLAIDAESMKYSTQLPVPIKWRLQSTTHTREDSDGDTIDYSVHSVSNIILTNHVLLKQSL